MHKFNFSSANSSLEVTLSNLLDRSFLRVALLTTGFAFLSACSTSTLVNKPSVAASASAKEMISCQLDREAAGYEGTCTVTCSANALAINFDGIEPKRACTTPNRVVNASLATTTVAGRWLGTMQGVKPEDPTRLEIVPNKTGTGLEQKRQPRMCSRTSKIKYVLRPDAGQ